MDLVTSTSIPYSLSLNESDGNLIVKCFENNEKFGRAIDSVQLPNVFALLEEGKILNITVLDLSHCGICELPNALKPLRLKTLNLSNNKFTAVPSCFYSGCLIFLENLNLAHNLLVEFDNAPDCISNLKVVMLNSNCFKNIPVWFLKLQCLELEELNYSENQATHYTFINCNFNMMRLSKCELMNSCLRDSDLLWLKCFKQLQYLDIGNKNCCSERSFINRFRSCDGLFELPACEYLTVLKLSNLDISIFPEALICIQSLMELHISHNFLSWLPESIDNLKNLEFLDVSYNSLVMIPQEIINLTQLKVLLLCSNRLCDIPTLSNSLKVLDCYGNCIKTVDNTILTNIQLLDLDYNFLNLDNNSYQPYCLKRDQFREKYKFHFRSCTSKPPEDFLEDNCSISSTSDLSDAECSVDVAEGMFNSLPSWEDWDEEIEDCKRRNGANHPEITLSDNEFTGDIHVQDLAKPKSQNWFKLAEEDWIFMDAD